VLRELLGLHPELPGAVLEDAYGRVLARRGLPPLERELLAVAMLAGLRASRQAAAHAIGARRLGASRAEVLAAVAFATPCIGPAAIEDLTRALDRRLD
jgi:alkylhydroperoxidase/carboxymuconolactone decarboxylase family protein YurZ